MESRKKKHIIRAMKMRSVFPELLHKDNGQKQIKESKDEFCSFLSRTHPNSDTVNMYCCRLLLTQRQSACTVQRHTAQHIYCTNTVQTVQSATELYLQ